MKMTVREMLTKEKLINIVDVIIEYSLYGMILFIPKSKAAIEIFAGFAIFFFLIKKTLNPDFKFLKSLPCLFLLLFVGFCAISIFNSGIYVLKSFRTLIGKWIEYALIFLFIGNTLRNRQRICIATYILLIFGVVVGLDGLSQRLFGVELLWDNPMTATNNGLIAITGPFRHHNDFGAYLLIIASLFIGVLLTDKLGMLLRILLFLFSIVLIVALVFTYSRGSWLGFVFGIILMFIFSRKIKFLIPVLLIFIFLSFFVPGIKERSIFNFTLQSPTNIVWYDADRFRVWTAAFQMIRENPFLGKGLGTFMDYFSKYRTHIAVQYAHNCFLQIWAETGIFSLISFLAFVGSVIYQGVKKFKRNNDFVLLGLIGGVVGFLVHSFFDTQLYSLQLSILFWTCMGLIAAKTIST